MWVKKFIINAHKEKINYISISEELNAFASCSNDNYVNIYSTPLCKLIHSFNIKKPELVLLSDRPLSICIIYSSECQKILVYSVNGHLICEEKCETLPRYSFI